jgi:hypothetical protein
MLYSENLQIDKIMRKPGKFVFVSLILIGLAANSCSKEEGTGGTSAITGKVLERQYNANFTTLIEEFYATDEDVFIIYGDDQVYGDKVTTNFDGTYSFEYLREGNYKVFAYSEDSANYPTKHMIPVIKEVKVTGKNQTVKVDDIIILK